MTPVRVLQGSSQGQGSDNTSWRTVRWHLLYEEFEVAGGQPSGHPVLLQHDATWSTVCVFCLEFEAIPGGDTTRESQLGENELPAVL